MSNIVGKGAQTDNSCILAKERVPVLSQRRIQHRDETPVFRAREFLSGLPLIQFNSSYVGKFSQNTCIQFLMSNSIHFKNIPKGIHLIQFFFQNAIYCLHLIQGHSFFCDLN